MSLGVLNNTVDNWLGASHCQAGQGGTLSTLQELQNTMSYLAVSDNAVSDNAVSGGRKKRTNKRMNKRRTKKRMNKRKKTKKRKL